MGNPHPASTPIDFTAMGASAGDAGFGRKAARGRPSSWLLVSVLLLVGGGFALVSGIVDIVQQNSRISDATVAEGRADTSEQSVTFVATRSREYYVYATLDTADTDRRDRIINGTTCSMRFADGRSAQLSGSDQSSTVTIGNTSSVGSFVAPEGAVTISCRQNRSGPFAYFVSTATFGVLRPIAFIIGGAFALVASLLTGLAAHRARRRRRTGVQHSGWSATA